VLLRERAHPRDVEVSVPTVPPHRALYGAGLLRLRSGKLYARVLASRETAASKDAVLAIGRAIVNDSAAAPPRIMLAVPDPRAPNWPPSAKRPSLTLRIDRSCFFRSYLVLNSQYFLASQDILNLGPDVQGATSEYAARTPGGRPTRILVLKYGSPDAAQAALKTFVAAYLPDRRPKAESGEPAAAGSAKTEHGYVVWHLQGDGLAILLDAEDAGDAAVIAGLAAKNIVQSGGAVVR
jgi:hypothetical protein